MKKQIRTQTIKTEVFVTIDGKEFTDETEALNHERKLLSSNTKSIELIIEILKELSSDSVHELVEILYRGGYIENIGIVKSVDHYGGEGEGETYYDVFHLIDQNLFIKISGYYASHCGVEYYDGFDSIKKVEPKEKTITVYE